MEIRRVVALRGPNIWANSPVLEAWLALCAEENRPSNEFPGLSERIEAWLPSLYEHCCSEGAPGGFLSRLREGTYLGHVLEHLTLELQSLAGTPVGYGRTRESSEAGLYKVVVKYRDEHVVRASLAAAYALLDAAIAGSDFDVGSEVRRLRELADGHCLGPSTQAIVAAAAARGIPHFRLNEGSFVQLGQGKAQRRIWTAETDATSAVAEAIAQDKDLTRRLLGSSGVPVVQGKLVESAEEAWAAALDLGLPAVVKPRDANHGRGVCIGLTDRASVLEAYALAREEGEGVVVERYVPGAHHRVLVIDGRVVAASRGEPDTVVGDGRQTIAELVEALNRDPRRGEDETCPLSPVRLGPIAQQSLRQQGFQVESRPKAGQIVTVCHYGDYTQDVTRDLHPSVAAAAVLAARTVGLDIAGIDVVAHDISRPLEEQGGAVLEVNASPSLLMHLRPLAGQPQPVGAAIVSDLFPAGKSGRIPVVAVTGTNGKSTIVDLVAAVLAETGLSVGAASSDGLTISGRCLSTSDAADAPSARRLFMNPSVEVAVVEVGARGVLDEGLGFDRCQVAVVSNLGSGDHLGYGPIFGLDTLREVKRAPVDVVLPEGCAVLNAEDPEVAAFAAHCRGETLLFAADAASPALLTHLEAGGRAVFVDRDDVVLVTGKGRSGALPLCRIGIPADCDDRFHVVNTLAAIAAAWALGVPAGAIQAGFERVGSVAHRRRFRTIEAGGALWVLSLARNPSALAAVVASLDSRCPRGFRTAVYAASSDWRKVDAFEQGLTLGGSFDTVLIVDDQGAEATGPSLASELERGVLAGGRARSARRVHEIPAVDELLAEALAPELVMLQASSSAELEVWAARITTASAMSSGWSASCAVAVSRVSDDCPKEATTNKSV